MNITTLAPRAVAGQIENVDLHNRKANPEIFATCTTAATSAGLCVMTLNVERRCLDAKSGAVRPASLKIDKITATSDDDPGVIVWLTPTNDPAPSKPQPRNNESVDSAWFQIQGYRDWKIVSMNAHVCSGSMTMITIVLQNFKSTVSSQHLCRSPESGDGTARASGSKPLAIGCLGQVHMPTIVGYDDPCQTPEWRWIAANASLVHVGNGTERGVWEYAVNCANEHSTQPPDRIAEVMREALDASAQYVLFYQ